MSDEKEEEVIAKENTLFEKAKTTLQEAAQGVEEFGKHLYEESKTDGIIPASQRAIQQISQKTVEMAKSVGAQLNNLLTKERLHELFSKLQTSFNEASAVLPEKISDATKNIRVVTQTKLQEGFESTKQLSEIVIKKYGIPLVTAITEGITDSAYIIDQQYHISGNVGKTLKAIDGSLGITEKAKEIDQKIQLTKAIETVAAKGKEYDEYYTGGIGTGLLNKGIETSTKLYNYVETETGKAEKQKKDHTD